MEKATLFSKRSGLENPLRIEPLRTRKIRLTWDGRKMVTSYPEEKWWEWLIKERKNLLKRESK